MKKLDFKPISTEVEMMVIDRYLQEMNQLYFLQHAPLLPREMIEGDLRDYNRATTEATLEYYKGLVRR